MEQTTTETTPVSTRSVGIRFGLISAVVSIAYFVVMNVAGLDMSSSPWSFIGYAVGAVLVFLAHKHYKDNGDGFMSYGQGIGIAFWMGLISSVISSIFTYIYIKFIDTGYIQMMKDRQIAKMQEQGMPDDQIDSAMEISSMFFNPEMMLGMGLIFGVIGTIIIALIVTIFTQKKAPDTAF